MATAIFPGKPSLPGLPLRVWMHVCSRTSLWQGCPPQGDCQVGCQPEIDSIGVCALTRPVTASDGNPVGA